MYDAGAKARARNSNGSGAPSRKPENTACCVAPGSTGLTGNWSLDNSPGYLATDILNRLASPYETNPLGLNPLRDLVESFIDFDKVRGSKDMPIYISATNVETGRARVFSREEITLDVVMASACLPFMFQAVTIDGTPYWDGGYMGNPVLFPLIERSPCADIAICRSIRWCAPAHRVRRARFSTG